MEALPIDVFNKLLSQAHEPSMLTLICTNKNIFGILYPLVKIEYQLAITAREKGYFDVWAIDTNPWSTSLIIKDDNLEMLKWSHNNGLVLDASMCADAAMCGRLAIFRWLIKNNCPTNSRVCENAALMGQLTILKLARSCGCPWNTLTCANAALNGHVTILQWLRQQGCPWDATTCANAALNGHLAILKQAYIDGCPADWRVYAFAAKNNHLDVLQWAQSTRIVWGDCVNCAFIEE